MARPKAGEVNKSDFIREHLSLSTPDIVAKAKEAGLDIAPTLVYKVRSRAAAVQQNHTTHQKKTPPPRRIAAPKPQPGQNLALTKAAFIRAMPKEMTASEVVARGAEKGLTFSANYVYTLRSQQAGADKRESTGRRGPSATRPQPTKNRLAFRQLVIAVGVDHARETLDEVERELAGTGTGRV